jgi:signal transduction histidine kinase
METQFASPERASQEQLQSDIEHTKNLPLVQDLTNVIPDAFVILNQHRQIVYCNTTLMSALAIESPEKIYGLRPGEALNCTHADETPEGCGTTASCKYCGAVNAIVKSQKEENTLKEEECRLVVKNDNQSLDFSIRAKTLSLLDQKYTLFIVKDNSNEKRRQVLERIFFHDILNTAGGLQGLMSLMKDASETEMAEFLDLAESSSNTLVEEINAQRDILAAENDNLEIEMTGINSMDILSSVIAVYQNHQVAEGKTLQIDQNSVSKDLISDPRLLIRIIGNMSKNALEAEIQGQAITLGVKQKDETMEFWVHNPLVMPQKVKMQIFQRSFSTKGTGRGLGTYSIKILGEKYLKGKVSFCSEEGNGTIFSLELPMGI